MVINWTRLLGSPRIVVHSQDPELSPLVAHALWDHVADVVLVRCGTAVPDLTSTEQAILFVLAKNAGHTVSREAIRRAVWGAIGAPPSNIVDRHVRSLRSKLGDSWREPRYIATVRQHGYRLVAA